MLALDRGGWLPNENVMRGSGSAPDRDAVVTVLLPSIKAQSRRAICQELRTIVNLSIKQAVINTGELDSLLI